jgi:hypothetical protein
MSATQYFNHELLDQEWLKDYRNAEREEPPSSMKRAAHMPASSCGKRGLRSTSLPSHDLVDALFRNTVSLSEAGSGFSRFMPCNDFGVAISFFGCMVSLWHLRERRVVEHLHDVKRSQPNIEASCGFEPPMGHYGAGHSPA